MKTTTMILHNLLNFYYFTYIKLIRLLVFNPYGHCIANILLGLIIRSYFFSPLYYAVGPAFVIGEQVSNEGVIANPASENTLFLPSKDVSTNPTPYQIPGRAALLSSQRAARLAAEQAFLSSQSQPPAFISSQQAAIISSTPEQPAIISSQSSTIDTATTSPTTVNISSTPEQPAQTPSIWKTLLIRVKNLFVWLLSLFFNNSPDNTSESETAIPSESQSETIIPIETKTTIANQSQSQNETIIASESKTTIANQNQSESESESDTNSNENLNLSAEKVNKILVKYEDYILLDDLSTKQRYVKTLEYVNKVIPAQLWDHSPINDPAAVAANPLSAYRKTFEHIVKFET